jgi:hypothetical protein
VLVLQTVPAQQAPTATNSRDASLVPLPKAFLNLNPVTIMPASPIIHALLVNAALS